MDGQARSRRMRGGLAGLVVGVLACSVVTTTASVVAGGRTTVRWFVGLGAPQEAAKERQKQMQAVVRAFNRENPDLKLVLQIGADPVHAEIATRIAGARPPDLIGPVTLTSLSYANDFVDLQPLIDAAGFDLAAFEPGLVDLYRDPDGRLIGLPFGAYPTITYWNKDLFEAAGLEAPPTGPGASYTMPDGSVRPWDVEAVAEIAKRLTVDADGNDATSPDFDPANVVQWGYHDQHGDLRRTLSTIGGAAPLVSTDATAAQVVTIDPAWQGAAAWWWDRIWTDHTMPTQAQVSGPLLGDNPFASGRVALVTAPLWYTCCLRDTAGTPVGGWDLASVPAGLEGTITSPIHADLLAITARSRHPEAAFRVLAFLMDDPRAGALWAVAPAQTAERAAWYAASAQTYPGVTDWAVADAMLAFPDIPSHQSDLPDAIRMQQRLVAFRQLLMADDGGGIDITEALATLQADLQAIVDAE